MKITTRLIGALLGAGLLGSTAMAADLPQRSPPPAPAQVLPIFTWQGFYAGLQAGYQWGRTSGFISNGVFAAPFFPYRYNTQGMVGGLHAGYNAQWDSFVLGVEGDIEFSGVRGSQTIPAAIGAANFSLFHRTKERWQGSLRLRAGYAIDRTLLYVTGGLAYNNRRYTYGTTLAAPNTASYTAGTWGWTAGAGIEYALNNSWTMRGEYRYAQYAKAKRHSALPVINIGDTTSAYKTHTFRIGVSYLFGGPAAPVVAKY